jgi:biopolymer transport protein ExbD
MAGKEEHSEIDLAPMVDVAFLLLTFFMMTTTFRDPENPEAKLNRPKAHSSSKQPNVNIITITVSDSASGSKMFLKLDAPGPRTRVSETLGTTPEASNDFRIKDIPALEKALIAARNAYVASNIKEQQVILTCDSKARYGAVSDIMGALKKAQLQQVQLLVDFDTVP